MKTAILIPAFFLLTSLVVKPQTNSLTRAMYSNDSMVTAIAVTDKYFWIGTKIGLWKINRANGKKVHYMKSNSKLPSDNISAIAVEADGNLWVGTNKGIMRYDNYSFYALTAENSSIPNFNITSIAIDQYCNIWLGTADAGIVLIKKNKKKLHFIADKYKLYSDSVLRLVSKLNGSVFVEYMNGNMTALRYADNGLENAEIKSPSRSCSMRGILVTMPGETVLLHVSDSIPCTQKQNPISHLQLRSISGYKDSVVKSQKDSLTAGYMTNLRTDLSKYLALNELKITLSSCR